MKFTPFNIRNQEFNKAVRGYDKDEVRAFLERLSDDYEKLKTENDKISKKLADAEEQIKEFKRIEKSLQHTLLNAQESSSKSVESAKKQTALMLKEAELKASQMVEKAKENASGIRDSVLVLREEKKLLVARLKAMVNSQISLLDMNVRNIVTKEEQNKPVPSEEINNIDVDDILEKLL